MKKALKFSIFILLLFVFFKTNCAAVARDDLAGLINSNTIVQVGSVSDNGGITQLYRQNGNRVFCLKKGGGSPAYGAGGNWTQYTCSSSYSFPMNASNYGKENNLKAALGYVVDQYNGTLDSYNQLQQVIWNLLYTYTNGENIIGDQTIYNNAVAVYNKYGNESLSLSNFNLTLQDGNWKGSSIITSSNIDEVEIVSLKKGGSDLTSYASISGNSVVISIPRYALPMTGDVVLEVSGTTNYSMIDARHCADNRQPIGEITSISSTPVTKNAKANGTIAHIFDIDGVLDGVLNESGLVENGELYGEYVLTINGEVAKWSEEIKFPNSVYDYYNDKMTYGSSYEISVTPKEGYVYLGYNISGGTNVEYTDSHIPGTVQSDIKIRLIFSTLKEFNIIKNTMKKDANGKPIPLYGRVEFKIYNDQISCENNTGQPIVATTQNGHGNVSLQLGTYYIKEINAPEDYQVDGSCKPITVTKDGTNEITLTNKTKCEYDFELNSSISNRLKMYQKYGYKNLLNFTINDSVEACSVYDPNYNSVEKCLYTDMVNATTQTQFTNTNLSDYNDTINSNGKTNYCLTNFKLNSLTDINNPVKAGQMVYGFSENNAAFTGTITKTCYIHETDISNYNNEILKNLFGSKNLYSKNVGNIYLDNKHLNPTINVESTQPSITTPTGEGEFYKVTATMSVSYKLNPVYLYKLTGKECDGTNIGCTVAGYGILSKFVDATNPANYFKFLITEGSDSVFEFNDDGNNCEYTVEPEIIKYNNDNGKIDLEFRTIDTANPFEREPNSNWNDGSNENDSKNKFINDYIISATNSYGLKKGENKKQDPIYKITLTPDTIIRIRGYNIENKYDGYYELCEDDSCRSKSKFIDDLYTDGVIE